MTGRTIPERVTAQVERTYGLPLPHGIVGGPADPRYVTHGPDGHGSDPHTLDTLTGDIEDQTDMATAIGRTAERNAGAD